VRALVRSGGGSSLDRRCETVEIASLDDESALARGFEGADAVLHLAGLAHAIPAPPEERYRHVNVAGTRHVAGAAVVAGVRRLLLVSTIKVNGERTIGRSFEATDIPAPEDAYARSKFDAECVLAEIASAGGMEWAVVRPPLVYGPGVRANFERLVHLVARGWPLPFASVGNRRTMVGVWNLCDLLGRALEHPGAAGRVFLAGDARAISTPELIGLIARALGRPARLVPCPVPVLEAVAQAARRPELVARLVESLEVSIAAAGRHLEWVPPDTVEQGIDRTVRAMAAGA
jgi:nucleoside-diphosphate-sugar epimerase